MDANSLQKACAKKETISIWVSNALLKALAAANRIKRGVSCSDVEIEKWNQKFGFKTFDLSIPNENLSILMNAVTVETLLSRERKSSKANSSAAGQNDDCQYEESQKMLLVEESSSSWAKSLWPMQSKFNYIIQLGRSCESAPTEENWELSKFLLPALDSGGAELPNRFERESYF